MPITSGENQEDIEDIEQRNMILTLLGNETARHFFLLLLEKCNCLGQSFCADNAFQTAFNDGTRAPAIWLKDMIEAACPGEFGRLLTESTLIAEKKNVRRAKQQSALESDESGQWGGDG